MVNSEIQNSANNSLRAILIGIDFYFPNSLSNGTSFRSLGGCVNDITRVENFLTRRVGMKSENIIKLTASNSDGFEEKPLESSEKWPTYENMVKHLSMSPNQQIPVMRSVFTILAMVAEQRLIFQG